MNLYDQRVSTKLLSVTTAVNVNQTGTTLRIADPDPSNPQVPLFKVSTVVSATGGASTPTAQVVIETSADGTTWIQAAAGTVRAADGQAYAEVLDPNNGFLLPFVRARLVLAGGTLPSATCQVEILSNQQFLLLPV